MDYYDCILPSGSFEMKKLRQAIMGMKGKNLDDLENMDGKNIFILDLNNFIIFLCRVCSHF